MAVQSKPVIPQNDNVAHALAGAGGGILSMILTYPLITLSTRAQVESRRAETAFLAAVQRIVAREGVSGLYSGLSSALFGISVTNFVYYYWYEWTRAFFEAAADRAGRASRKLTTLESMAAGAIAGSATVILTNPIWVINTRMTARKTGADSAKESTTAAVEKPGDAAAAAAASGGGGGGGGGGRETDLEKQQAPASSAVAEAEVTPPPQKKPTRNLTTIGTLLALLRNEGPAALFAGVVPALVLVINPILQYTLFEQMKNAVERRGRRVTPTIAFALGALGKLFATSVTYPYITVKSQMHVASGSGEKKQKEGTFAALARVVREEGYAGLYKGIGPKVTQSVLTAALLFAFKDVLYERTVRLRSTVGKKAVAAAAAAAAAV